MTSRQHSPRRRTRSGSTRVTPRSSNRTWRSPRRSSRTCRTRSRRAPVPSSRRRSRRPRVRAAVEALETATREAAMTERRRPLHLAVLVGTSAAVYAASLAGVASLQSAADKAVIDGQGPAEQAAGRLHDGHDRLQADLDEAAQRFAESAARYEILVKEMAAMESD